ncbi:zinc-finger of the MIZ type in Nse subunit-domain-containing protein [Podospora appendiculata]|uniref:Zinc-finger of the MIZ type in Nse subunit-domain-containing protein n=1 Tax=Podospora appendiculata TaxID=314037 RepID=A0AAE1C8A8_9PEZI|nr:zinc-finger of the MIZ type in Nse subunit-domain-containing protein [Podospora appendiculata]
MPRLFQGSRRPRQEPAAVASASASAGRSTAAELPPYEPPAFPMDDAGKRALAEIVNSRETRKYEQHLTRSANLLRDSVASVNDVLFARRQSLAAVIERRNKEADGVTEKSEAEKSKLEAEMRELEQYTAQLQAETAALTDSTEAAIREVIDYRAELEDEKHVFEAVQEKISAQRPRPEPKARKPKRDINSDDENDDQEAEEMLAPADDPPLTGVRDMLKTVREAKAEEYNAMTAYQRYGLNNDYISFKKTWHDAQHHEDQVPLPDASTWFDELGRATTGGAPDAEDDDLVVEREIIDLKCPLSLQTLSEPYSNHKCRHTFQKSAIMDFLRDNRGVAKCPVCSEELRVKDLYLDELILRKIKRAEQARLRNVDDTSDVEPDDNDGESLLIEKERATNVKKERGRPRRAPNPIDDEEDDD